MIEKAVMDPPHDAGGSGEETADNKRLAGDPVGIDPHQLGGIFILRHGADRFPQPGFLNEEV